MRFVYKNVILFCLLTISTQVIASTVANSRTHAIQKVASSFKSLCQSHLFSGTVLIAINGNVRLEKACGLASRNFSVPNTISTKFNLCSVGKLFTAVAIAQLIQAKKLSLDTHVVDLVPSWLPMTSANKITVKQLLIHASGLGNFMEDTRWKQGADSGFYNKTDDYKPLIKEEKLLFEPGTSQAYSNSGYIILGKLIEKLSGMTYEQYVQKNIFAPAHMGDTGIWPLDDIVKNRAVGYYYSCKRNLCKWKNNYYQAPFIGTAAGGAYSTINDLFKFSQFLYQNKFLNSHLTQQMLLTTVIRPSDDVVIKSIKIGGKHIPEAFSPYGFAGAWNTFGVAVWKKPNLIGHTGGTPGAGALFAMSPDNKYTIIILSNSGSKGQVALYQKIRDDFGFKGPIKNF